MREHLRAVVWPRQTSKIPSTAVDANGNKVYRYTIVGILVTDRELTLAHENEVVVDGGTTTIGLQLEGAVQRLASYPMGDAVSVLVGLEHI